ncbi:MAG TPA: class III lanthionine synthetase LanKC [Streptosporangiaceae bacterium]|nr:class III lanthionine synthetase LanKC [Streptosporangiaceae bacterium]
MDTSLFFSPQRVLPYFAAGEDFFTPYYAHGGQDRGREGNFAKLLGDSVPADWGTATWEFWASAVPPELKLPAQGWKIHISSTVENAEQTLARVIEVVVASRAACKVLADTDWLRLMNSKDADRRSAGKFIVVYPRTTEELRALVVKLADATTGLAGPYVLTDRRFPGSRCVFYRYGEIIPSATRDRLGVREPLLTDPDGVDHPDERAIPYTLPPWVKDPFPDEPEPDSDVTAFFEQYNITEALQFSSAGGVYRAVHTPTGQHVAIKEARPLITCSSGQDAPALLRKEHAILDLLSDCAVPEAREIRQVWEHTYLVMSFLAGDTLAAWANSRNPRYGNPGSWAAYLRDLVTVWSEILQTIQAGHRRGVVFGDLSASNFLVDEADGLPRPVMIDLEGAVRVGTDPDPRIYTAAFASPQRLAGQAATIADDVYSMAVLLAFTLGAGPHLGPHAPRLADRCLHDLAAEHPVPASVLDWITRALAGNPADRPSLAVLHQALDLARVGRALPRRVGGQRGDGASSEPLPDNAAVAGDLARQIISAATPETDVLYAADPAAYATNALGFGYGAAGVIRALSLCGHPVPDSHLNWLLNRAAACDENFPVGLHTGLAGITWVLGDLDGPAHYYGLLERVRTQRDRSDFGHDLFAGDSGVGLALLHAFDRTGDQAFLAAAEPIARQLRDNGHTEHEGLLFGPSGLALCLTEWARRSDDTAAVAAAARWLAADTAKLNWRNGRVTGFLSHFPGGARLSPYILDGLAGLAVAAARLHTLTPSPATRHLLRALIPALSSARPFMGGFLSGQAGIAYALAEISRALPEPSTVEAAQRAAARLCLYTLPRGESLAFLGEQNLRFSLDFNTGAAGAAVILVQSLAPDSGDPSPDLIPSRTPVSARTYSSDEADEADEAYRLLRDQLPDLPH